MSEAGGPSGLERLEVAVVGAGQAGLAIGHLLARDGRRFALLEAGSGVGMAWRERWDSLTLFTPRRYDALPGLPFPGNPDGHPTRDEVVSYLETYAETFALPIRFSTPVASLAKADDGFLLTAGNRLIAAEQVVVATGPFQMPATPPVADGLSDDVVQMHSVAYRRPADVPRGRVLVVGGGNTGFQIAKELSAHNEVTLAVGSRQAPLPQRLLGRDVFWWLARLGLLEKDINSRFGRRARGRDTLIGSSPRELRRRYGVTLKPRLTRADGRAVGFADGSELNVDAVVWATGYRPDYSWIKLPIFDDDGTIRHRRGVTGVAGLFFLGLAWQHTRGSALLGWVKHDAEFIARQIESPEPDARPAPLADGASEELPTEAATGVI